MGARFVTLAAALVLCAPPASAGDAEAPAEIAALSGPEAAVWTLLLPPASAGTPDVKTIVAAICRSGADPIGPIVGILLGESAEPDVAFQIHPKAIELRRQILVDCLRKLPEHDAIDGLRSRITPRTSVDARIAVIGLLSEIGGVRAFDAILAIATALEPIHWQRTFVQGPIEAGLVRTIGRNPRLARRLEQSLSEVPVEFAPIAVRALAAARASTAVRALPNCLGRDPALDQCVLKELAALGSRFDPLGDLEVTRRVRALLDSPDLDVRLAAAVALANFGDADSFATLVTRLMSPDPIMAGAARWSLETLTGMKLGTDPAAWTAWRLQENEWVEERLSRLADDVLSGEPTKVMPAIEELSRHRLLRHDVATALHAALAPDADPAAQRLVCEVLARLGSPRALPWLVEKLESPHEEVRHAAWTGLRAMTRMDLPAEVGGWKIALAP